MSWLGTAFRIQYIILVYIYIIYLYPVVRSPLPADVYNNKIANTINFIAHRRIIYQVLVPINIIIDTISDSVILIILYS